MNQDRDLVEEERQAARLQARAADRPRPSGMDSGTRKLALVAGGLGALLVLMVGGWSLLGHRPAGIPVLAPPPGPVRIKPTDPGGMQLMGAQVAQTNGPGAQALAPGPEQAAPQALEAEVDAARKADAPPAPAAPTPTPTPTPPAGGTRSAPAAPVTETQSSTDAAPSAPGSGDQTETAPQQQIQPQPQPQSQSQSQTSLPAAADVAPAAAAGHHAVQLAALDSDQAARAEWTRLSRRAPGLFEGHAPIVVPASRGGKQFYRLRTGGFDSIAAATAFCGQAKAAGIACTLADF